MTASDPRSARSRGAARAAPRTRADHQRHRARHRHRRGAICFLGTVTAQANRDVHVGEQLVAVGWTLERRGRLVDTASIVLDDNAATVASARAVWVALEHP